MTESSSLSPKSPPLIPIEFVTEEEMSLIDAALAATTSSLSSRSSPCSYSFPSSPSSSSQFQRNGRSVESITFYSKRKLSVCSETESLRTRDIEDFGEFKGTQKKLKVLEGFLHRFRRKRGLAITDITATEWCEKQMEFVLLRGKPKDSEAMKAGKARHTKLEEEVLKKVEVRVEAAEDAWAVKFMNFIAGAHQLLFEGLTRELPLIGFVEGVWMVGVIDEIRMPATDTVRNPLLVETKTRTQASLPAEPQKRNGRLQLMCYKYLWDNAVTDNFHSSRFFTSFGLNPHYILSEEIQKHTASSGFPAKTLEDLVTFFKNTCCMLPPAHDQLLLRYEFQGDDSLLGEEHFLYDPIWLMSRIKQRLEFWLGEREAGYVPPEERWKCQTCKFASICPSNTTADGKSS
ncbi:Exonuclease V [Macleaya cordata]|uniref:Exonuclease V n=1 Tax=Macleaya cordata TaxID=56857 RepID=A0A200R603_MACCD|nr:Exonuclease V [Macleaya cordata]